MYQLNFCQGYLFSMDDISGFLKHFPHQPTDKQLQLFEELHQFLKIKNQANTFLIKGYAGTGKTSVVSSLIKNLPQYNLKYILLAPTGRAAKVISQYTGRPATTIHRKIYRKKSNENVNSEFGLGNNIHTDTVFIVDEASMISDEGAIGASFQFSNHGLLTDLCSYVYSVKKNNRIIFIGDTAQLPPVGTELSPALSAEYLDLNFNLYVSQIELTEVLRQQQQSGILENATRLRNLVNQDFFEQPVFITKNFKDTFRLNGDKLEDGLRYAYDKFGLENTLILCRSNKKAIAFNQHIRNKILNFDEEISVGDYLMVVKNNYFWLKEESEIGFIANGEIARIKKVKMIEELFGFRFANVLLEFIDYPNEPPLTCKIVLESLTAAAPALEPAQNKMFQSEISLQYNHVKNKREKYKLLSEDSYYNALQVKFAYAVTCHKAQGGQWDAVFIDQGYLTDEMLNSELLRWLYTATSRAVQQLFYVNFGPEFFEQ